MRHSFLFVGTHFQIFVRKFPVHLRTVHAPPQKLARPPHVREGTLFIGEGGGGGGAGASEGRVINEILK